MTPELKKEIIDAANVYISEKGITATDLSKLSGVNAGYLSNMLRFIFEVQIQGTDKPTEINDRWFKKLAKTIGFSIESVRWDVIPTVQFQEIITALDSAKKQDTCGIIIAETGAGKTFAVDRFVLKNPLHTYRITVSSLHTLPAIMDDLLEVLGLNGKWRMKNKLELIGTHMRKLKDNGENPIIIIDESENLKIGAIRALKALYDMVNGYCSIMLIATPELDSKLERMRKNERDGVPQFCRRFKAGTRYISPVNRDFDMFFKKHVQDAGLRKLLLQLSDNYGELKDWLFPVMREMGGKPVTEEAFRLYHNMPITK